MSICSYLRAFPQRSRDNCQLNKYSHSVCYSDWAMCDVSIFLWLIKI